MTVVACSVLMFDFFSKTLRKSKQFVRFVTAFVHGSFIQLRSFSMSTV